MKHATTFLLLFTFYFSSSQTCTPGDAEIDLNVNNINAHLRNSGDLWWDGSNGKYITPSDGFDDVSAIFAGGLWIGGVDPVGSLKLAAVQYRNGANGDFYPGPLEDNTGQAFQNGCVDWDRFWIVNKSEVDAHILDFADGSITDEIENIYSWPGRNNPHFEALLGFPMPLNQKLAPFFDNDQDGNYDPDNGDYPLIKGDQSIWWVFNDNAGIHGATNATPIQIEAHSMAYAFSSDDNEDLNNATFYDFEFINKGPTDLRDAYLGLWVDFDLGCHEDDYVGYDIDEQMMYVYNTDAVDGSSGSSCAGGVSTYGNNVPMLGIKKLDGSVNPITSHVSMNNASTGGPSSTFDPDQDFEFYNYLKGLWRDGTEITVGGTGFDPSSSNTTTFAFSGDPSDPNGWSMCTAGLPLGDRRSIMSAALPDFLPGQSISASYAVIYVDDITYPCPSLDRLKEAADAVSDAVLNSEEELIAESNLSISPNPAIDRITIKSENMMTSIEVIDLNGQSVIIEKTNLVNSKSLDISDLASGIYFISVTDNKGLRSMEKIVKN